MIMQKFHIFILILIIYIGGRPVITDCKRSGRPTMGQYFNLWQSRTESIEDNNFRWWIKRYEKGWEQYPPPWYLKERVDEYLENN